MVGPELLADVRQLEPGVDQDALAMAGLDQLASDMRPARGRVRRYARRRRAGRRCRPCASARRSNPDRRGSGRRNRRKPRGGWSGTAGPGRDRQSAFKQIGKALVAALAGRDGDPKDGAGAAAGIRRSSAAPVQRSRAKTCAPSGRCRSGAARGPFSQTIGRVGRCTSVRLCDLDVLLRRGGSRTSRRATIRLRESGWRRCSTRAVHSAVPRRRCARRRSARRRRVGAEGRWRRGSPARRPRHRRGR